MFGAIFPCWGLMLAKTQAMFYYTDPDTIRDHANTLACYYILLGVLAIFSATLQVFPPSLHLFSPSYHLTLLSFPSPFAHLYSTPIPSSLPSLVPLYPPILSTSPQYFPIPNYSAVLGHGSPFSPSPLHPLPCPL